MIARTELRSESLNLAADVSAPLNARLFVSQWLTRWNLDHIAEAARAGITELVAWIVAHPAGALLRITLSADGPLVFTEATDSGTETPWRPAWLLEEPKEPDLEGEQVEGGEIPEARGLAVKLLEAAALEWGADEMPGGRCLWASYRTVPAEPDVEAA